MKAIAHTEYGAPEVLPLVEIPKPAPRARQALVQVYAATVAIGDTIMRSLNIPGPRWQKVMAQLYLGWNKPKRPILGMELAGAGHLPFLERAAEYHHQVSTWLAQSQKD